jgi:hypothetical protein
VEFEAKRFDGWRLSAIEQRFSRLAIATPHLRRNFSDSAVMRADSVQRGTIRFVVAYHLL